MSTEVKGNMDIGFVLGVRDVLSGIESFAQGLLHSRSQVGMLGLLLLTTGCATPRVVRQDTQPQVFSVNDCNDLNVITNNLQNAEMEEGLSNFRDILANVEDKPDQYSITGTESTIIVKASGLEIMKISDNGSRYSITARNKRFYVFSDKDGLYNDISALSAEDDGECVDEASRMTDAAVFQEVQEAYSKLKAIAQQEGS